MTYHDLINIIVGRGKYKRYLEIGVQHGHCFNAVRCESKTGVDLCCASPATHHMSSDAFFKMSRQQGVKWDFIFVDGDHRFLPALRDIVNALDRLEDGGTVLVDNVNPQTFDDQRLSEDGTAWRAWATLRVSRRDLEMVVIERGHGWGLIRRGSQELYAHDEPLGGLPCYFGEHWDLTWEYFERFRKPLMNMVTLDEFMRDHMERWFGPAKA